MSDQTATDRDDRPAERRTPKIGRRPGQSETREQILKAARGQFAEHGAGATVRAIANAANVDPALVLHYYRSKDALFVAAMDWPFDYDDAVGRIVSGSRSRMGKRLADFFLSIWDHPELREPVVGLLRAATTSPPAADLLREALGKRLLARVGAHLNDPDAPLRMSLCASQLVGIGIARYIVEIEPLSTMTRDGVAQLIAPTLQRYLTGPLPPG